LMILDKNIINDNPKSMIEILKRKISNKKKSKLLRM
jgi:hypothetical protein